MIPLRTRLLRHSVPSMSIRPLTQLTWSLCYFCTFNCNLIDLWAGSLQVHMEQAARLRANNLALMNCLHLSTLGAGSRMKWLVYLIVYHGRSWEVCCCFYSWLIAYKYPFLRTWDIARVIWRHQLSLSIKCLSPVKIYHPLQTMKPNSQVAHVPLSFSFLQSQIPPDSPGLQWPSQHVTRDELKQLFVDALLEICELQLKSEDPVCGPQGLKKNEEKKQKENMRAQASKLEYKTVNETYVFINLML